MTCRRSGHCPPPFVSFTQRNTPFVRRLTRVELGYLRALIGASEDPTPTPPPPPPPEIESTLTLVSAHAYDPEYYWAAVEGRASNYQGSYALLGTDDYVWWSVDGVGHDPGSYVTELDSLSGHEVALTDGDSASDVATATAAVIAAVAGWEATPASEDCVVVGPAAVTSPFAWDDRGDAGLAGMLSSRGDAPGYAEGPTNSSCNAQCLIAPAQDGVLHYLDVFIGSVPGADRTRYVVYRGSSTVSPVPGSEVLGDFGQVPVARPTDGWVRLFPAAPVPYVGGETLWVTWYGNGVTTTNGLYGVGSPSQISTFIDQAFVVSDGDMPTDETLPPTPWIGDVTTPFPLVAMIRLGYETSPFMSLAELHSEADPLIVGAHIEATDNLSTLQTNAILTQTTQIEPSIGPTTLVAAEMAVAVHGTNQPRLGIYTGADFSDQEEPDITGATRVSDGGRMSGSAGNVWVAVAQTGELAAGAVVTVVLVHGGPAGPGSVTSIRYTAFGAWDDADPLDAPADWVRPAVPGVGVGPEVATLSTVGAFSIDPSQPLPATIPALGGAALRPGNVGGNRCTVRCRGFTVA